MIELATLSLIVVFLSVRLAAADATRVAFPESVRPVARATEAAQDGRTASVVRSALTAAEAAAPMDFSLPLRMRNFAELQARVARGDIIPRAEMEEKYLPLPADYEKVAAWAVAKGFTVTYPDASRLSVFLRGPVGRVAETFQTSFGRVAAGGGEFTSALTAPSVPTALATALLGVNGLQPHLRARRAAPASATPMALTSSNTPPYLPSEILQAYRARTTGLTGAGQTIAIIIDTYLLPSDLTTFWTNTHVNQSLANIQRVTVAPDSGTDTAEATIDAEMTSALAPGATIRLYTTGTLAINVLNQAYHQVLNDLPTQPNLHQLNLSYGIGEQELPYSVQSDDSQVFAALAAGGVTVVAATGDGGSNPDSDDGSYRTTAKLQPVLPAADPSVTAVGGTTLTLDKATGSIASEVGWSVGTDRHGSGGGISTLFSKPDWQTGTGITGTQRQIPDVAILADISTNPYIVLNGTGSSNYGGTSFSSPIWAGIIALLNQARATAGQPPLGLFGPHIYPLIGTTAFHDILTGNNGAYSAGVGYDLVTGIGSPDVAALALALGGSSFAPTITAQPPSVTAAVSQDVTFRVTAIGNPEPSYRWQRRPAGGGAWADVTGATPYSGSASPVLTVTSITAAMSGDSFRCVLANPVGTATTQQADLIVANSLTFATLAGTAGASGTADGTGGAARFNHPADLAVDRAGNLFVADTNNHTIRKIASGGVVTTLAGVAGSSGTADGTAGAARFNHPTGIATDAAGNLYVADTGGNTVRKITPDASVSTLAHGFSSPSDVTVDSAGNVIVADTGSHTIRRVDSAGTVTTVAGLAGNAGSADGTGSAARFSAPEGVAVDSAGNIYVADTGNHTIRKITPAGVVSTLAGQAGLSGTSDGVAGNARFQFPSDLALDASGNLYVADTDNHTIRFVSPAGATGTVAGQAGATGATDGSGATARFYYPTGVAVDATGHVYVADTDNDTIRSSFVAGTPQITSQPRSESATVGFTARFSVTATGTPAPTYQWQLNGTAIAGATGATLTVSPVKDSDAGTYTVVVTNAVGSVTSSPATLTVIPATVSPGGGGGGGGGGGAPSPWFLATLLVLVAVRQTRPRGRLPVR